MRNLFAKIVRRLFGSFFYMLEEGKLYDTEDGVLISYRDLELEVVMPDLTTTFLFDLSEIDEGTVSILRKIDPFEAILDLDTESLFELREKYEKNDEFEVCEFITKEINKRKK